MLLTLRAGHWRVVMDWPSPRRPLNRNSPGFFVPCPLSSARLASALRSTRIARATPCTAASGMLVASQTRGGPDSLRWFWSMTVNGPMTRSGRVATLEEAKAQFQKSWEAWKAWAKLEETE